MNGANVIIDACLVKLMTVAFTWSDTSRMPAIFSACDGMRYLAIVGPGDSAARRNRDSGWRKFIILDADGLWVGSSISLDTYC